MRERVQELLWSFGLTPNYLGFTYLADILEMAANGHFVCRNSFSLVAQARGKSRSSVYQAVVLALKRMDLPADFPGPAQEILYQQINFLAHQLNAASSVT